MNKQHTRDRLCSFKEMKKQISFYLFSTKRLSWEQTDWKTNKKKALDQMFRIRWGSPNPGLIFKLFFPPRGKKLRKLCSIFRKKKKKKKNKKVRVRSVNFPIWCLQVSERFSPVSIKVRRRIERRCEWKCGRGLRATGPELVGPPGSRDPATTLDQRPHVGEGRACRPGAIRPRMGALGNHNPEARTWPRWTLTTQTLRDSQNWSDVLNQCQGRELAEEGGREGLRKQVRIKRS